MRLRLSFLLVTTSFLLVGCGVDTTGISPNSTKQAKGSDSASVTIVEYGDLQCPACKSAHELITTPLLAQIGDDVRFEFRHFPLRSIHPYAFKAAQAAECAADQGKFWEFLDIAYAQQDTLKTAPYVAWAGELGLDTDLFGRCLSSGIKGDAVLAEYAAGEKLNVRGTPTYFVNGTQVEATIPALLTAIQSARAQINAMPL